MAFNLDTGQRQRLGTSGFEVFEPTAEGVLAWVKSTRPVPPREKVIEHVRTLIDEGLLPDAERRKLVRKGYRELAD